MSMDEIQLKQHQTRFETIDDQQVENWLGYDWKFSEIVEIIKDLANGDYCQHQMKVDILENERD